MHKPQRPRTIALTTLLTLCACEAPQPAPQAARDASRAALTVAVVPDAPGATAPGAPLTAPAHAPEEGLMDDRRGQAAPSARGQIAPKLPDPADSLPAADVEALRLAQAQLGVALLMQLPDTSSATPHLLIAPHLAHTNLSMLMLGARGADQDALRAALHVSALEGREHETAAAFHSLLYRDGVWSGKTKFGLTLINRLWLDATIKLSGDYLRAMHQAYPSQLAQPDLSGDPSGALALINGWAKAVSQDRFNPLLAEDALAPNTAMLTTSALHLFGYWEHPFDAQGSVEADFKAADGTTTRATMMRLRAPLRYAHAAGHELLALPSHSADWEIVLALPTGDIFTPDALARALVGAARRGVPVPRPIPRAEFLTRAPHPHQPTTRIVWEGGAPTRPIDLLLPKLTMRSQLRLERALAQLGFAPLIAPGANLSGISDAKQAKQLKLDHMFQEVQLSLDTLGFGEPQKYTSPPTPTVTPDALDAPDALTLRFDRPFLIAVRDVKTGLLLVVGKVHDVR